MKLFIECLYFLFPLGKHEIKCVDETFSFKREFQVIEDFPVDQTGPLALSDSRQKDEQDQTLVKSVKIRDFNETRRSFHVPPSSPVVQDIIISSL